ncbi:MAG: hypothetical protein ACTHMM_13410 [Agriterribacter sp.]
MVSIKKWKGGGKAALFSLIPFGLAILALLFVFQYIKRRGLLGALGGVLGVEESGSSQSIEGSESAVDRMSKDLAAKGVTVKNEHQLVANQLFALINEAHVNPLSVRFWSQNLYIRTQYEVCSILLDYFNATDGFNGNLKAIMVAYGVRNANNRQNALLGFVWDNAKGNLYDHIAWYMDDVLPDTKNPINNIDQPRDVKREILKALKISK